MDFYDWSFQEPLKVNKRGIPEPNLKKKGFPRCFDCSSSWV